ncbi:MAG: hypothetical protein R3345_15935 [Fulvivirga sp.]|nr:hypothetical protein [Fulvivirga sp.]
MRFFLHNIIGLLILMCCMQTDDKEPVGQQLADNNPVTTPDTPKEYEGNSHIRILNTGPRGGVYESSAGDTFRYTVFRIQLFNDTIIPVKLDIHFPEKPIALLPDSTIVLDVFRLPDEFTPDSIQDVFNFGVEMEDFFESGINKKSPFETSILPNEQQTLYVGILYVSNIPDGRTRAKLFLEGHDKDAPYFPVHSVEEYKVDNSPINLVYGISFDAPNYYAFIPCGSIYTGS